MCVACRAQVSLSGEEGKEKGSGGREVQKYILTIHEVYGWRRVPHGTKNFTPTSPERRLTPEFFFFFLLAVRRIKPRAFLGLRDRAKVSTQKPGPPENHQKSEKKVGIPRLQPGIWKKKTWEKEVFPPKPKT